MTHDERGLYITLLCVQWSQGSISAGDFDRIAGGSFNGSLERVKSKFSECKDGLFRNERLEFEREKQAAYRRSRSNNGSKGGRPRKAHAFHMVNTEKAQQKPPSPSPSPDLKERKRGFEKPTLDQIRILAQKAGLPEVEADKFFYHYDSKGWKVGKEPMRSLNSAIGGWTTRWRANGQVTRSQQSGGFD